MNRKENQMRRISKITCYGCGKCIATIVQNEGEIKIYPFVLPKDAYDKYEPDVYQITLEKEFPPIMNIFTDTKETVTYPIYCIECGNKGLE